MTSDEAMTRESDSDSFECCRVIATSQHLPTSAYCCVLLCCCFLVCLGCWSFRESVYMHCRRWLLGLSEYVVMFELRQRFTNIWTEVVSSNQVWLYSLMRDLRTYYLSIWFFCNMLPTMFFQVIFCWYKALSHHFVHKVLQYHVKSDSSWGGRNYSASLTSF